MNQTHCEAKTNNRTIATSWGAPRREGRDEMDMRFCCNTGAGLVAKGAGTRKGTQAASPFLFS